MEGDAVDRLNELVRARLYLGAILPRLEEIAAFDRETRQAIKDWRFHLRFQLPGGEPATTLVFAAGVVKAHRGRLNRPAAALTFKDARFLNEVFQGETGKSPRPNLRGFFHLRELLRMGTILQAIERYLRPGPELLANPETYAFCVQEALYVLAFGIKEVGEHDPAMSPVTARLPDGTMEIRVAGGRPAAHITVRGGRFTPFRGPAKKPSVYLETADLDTAWAMLGGTLDIYAAIGNEKIKVRGYLPLADGINPLLDRLAFYL